VDVAMVVVVVTMDIILGMVMVVAHGVMVVAHMVVAHMVVTVEITMAQEADGTLMRTIMTMHRHPHHVLVAVSLHPLLKKKTSFLLVN
jgi:hypothetical protein